LDSDIPSWVVDAFTLTSPCQIFMRKKFPYPLIQIPSLAPRVRPDRARFHSSRLTQLKQMITEQGKLLPRQLTGMKTKDHRSLARQVKQARILGLLPFITKK